MWQGRGRAYVVRRTRSESARGSAPSLVSTDMRRDRTFRALADGYGLPVTFMLLALWVVAAVTHVLPDVGWASLLLLLTTLTCAAAIIGTAPEGQWSLAFLTFLSLYLFHAGLFLTPALTGGPPRVFERLSPGWWDLTDLPLLASYVAVGLTAFCVGALMANRLWGDRTRRSIIPAPPDGSSLAALSMRRSIAAIGSLMMIASVVAWFAINIEASGPAFFLQRYRDYLDGVAGTPVGTTITAIAISLPMVVQDLRDRLSRIGVGAFALFALAGLPLGLRGEVLMPLVVAVAVVMTYITKRPRWLLAGASIVIFITITVVRQLRQVGLGNLGDAVITVNPLDSIEELGYSVRVLAYSLQWHEIGGEPFALGQTYVHPVVRNLNTVFGIQNPEASSDLGLFNSVIRSRIGEVGGSVMGEAHFNFGLTGIAAILMLWGIAIAGSSARAHGPMGVAIAAVIGVLFILQVRDASTATASRIAIAVGLLGAAWVLDRASRPARPPRSPGRLDGAARLRSR